MINKSALYQKIVELQSIHDNQNTDYDYQGAMDEMWKEISKEAFQQNLNEEQSDINKMKDKK
jgi:hypothetical protein